MPPVNPPGPGRPSTLSNKRLSIATLVLDVDGTLLDDHHQIMPRTFSALQQALRAGLLVILATGKSYQSTKSIRDQLGLVAPGVYVQGLATYAENGLLLEQALLSPHLVTRFEALARAHDLEIIAYGSQALYTPAAGVHSLALSAYHEPLPLKVNTLAEYPILKLLLIGSQPVLDHIRQQMTPLLQAQAAFVQAVPAMLEVLPPNRSKGRAVARLLAHLNRPMRTMLAIGDGENDIELIQLAQIGVAMGNARDELKKHADFITAGNNHEGVALALEKFILSS